jgi:hypothetical protein
MKTTLSILIMLAAILPPAFAQHEGHTMPKPAASPQPKQAPVVGDTTRKPQAAPQGKMDHSKMDHGTMDHSKMNHGSMEGMNHGKGAVGSVTFSPMGSMSHSLSRNLPMNRNGSGTSWMPDKTPMYANMAHSPGEGKWMYMLHYGLFLRHTNQNFTNPDKRGREARFDAPNWAMGMAQRTVGRRGLLRPN